MFKVEFYPNIDTRCETSYIQMCETLEEMVLVSNTIADYTLFLGDKEIMHDLSNSLVTYRQVGDDWIEIGEDGIEV